MQYVVNCTIQHWWSPERQEDVCLVQSEILVEKYEDRLG